MKNKFIGVFMSSLLILLDKNSSCIRRDFRVLASSENYVLLASGKSFSCFVYKLPVL